MPVVVFRFLLITLLALAAQAHASGWYADLGVGVNLAEDRDLNDAGAEAEFDMGRPIGSLAIAYEAGPRWRLEAELAYRRNDLETLAWPDADSIVAFNHHDTTETLSLMLNGIRRFRVGAFQPYVGGGLGAAGVRWRVSEADVGFGSNRIPGASILEDETVTVALQLIAGFDVPMTRRWGLGFDYRLWHAPDFSLTGAAGEDYELSHTTHSFQAHLRYLFAGEWQGSDVPAISPRQDGWLLSAGLGLGYAADSEVNDRVENLDAFRTGPVISLGVGRMLSPHWRLELLLERRENDVEVVDFNPETGQFPASGEVSATSLMVGIAYRFRSQHAIRPFVGTALGAAWLDFDVRTRDAVYLDDSDTTLAVSASAGLDIAMSERLDLSAALTSWYADPVKLMQPDGAHYGTWQLVHSMSLGLRYSL